MHKELNLGNLIEGDEQRDAIHVAVVPVESADQQLRPGARVGVSPDGKRASAAWSHVGIIDPFLETSVLSGEKCWLFLFPNTVTGMRHHWSHPSFDQAQPEPAVASEDSKQASWDWMREYARQHHSHRNDWYHGWGGPYTAEQLIDFATDYLKTGEKHVQQGSESLRDSMWVEATSNEFWKHFEIITGITPANYLDDRVPFCCTC